MKEIQSINEGTGTVVFKDGSSVDHKQFIEQFREFLQHRIAGETIVPADMERFMRRTSGKSLSQLMKSKKMEGYMEGSSDKTLTTGQKIAIGTIVTLSIVGVIIFVILRNQGIIPGA